MRRKLVSAFAAVLLCGCSSQDAVPQRTINEFPLTGLIGFTMGEPTDEAGLTIGGVVNVQRHSTNPLTFDPSNLEFEVAGVQSGIRLASTSRIVSTIPDPTQAEVSFRVIVPGDDFAEFTAEHPEESQLQLTVSLGSEQARTRVTFP